MTFQDFFFLHIFAFTLNFFVGYLFLSIHAFLRKTTW